MKRAQFEAMGLAVIVILVSLGMFLYIFFQLNDSKAEFVARYNNEQLAQNTVDAMLKTHVDDIVCPQTDVADLIEDVFVLRRNPCASVDPSRESSVVLEEIAQVILDKTLGEREIPYVFTITEVKENREDEVPTVVLETCDITLYQSDRSGEQILTLFPSLQRVRVELIICAEPNP